MSSQRGKLAARSAGSELPWRSRERGRSVDQRAWNSLRKYALESPIATATAAILLIGGLQLLGYFVHLGFMPDFDLQSSTSLLYAVAVLGLAIGVSTVAGLVLPGPTLAWMRKEVPEWMADHRSLPWVACFAASAPIVTMLYQGYRGVSLSDAACLLLAALLFAGLWAAVAVDRNRGNEWRRMVAAGALVIWWAATLWVLQLLGLGLGLLYGIHGQADMRTEQQVWLILFALHGLGVLCAAVLGIAAAGNWWRLALPLGAALASALILLTGGLLVPTKLALRSLSLAEIDVARALVSPEGCSQINGLLGQMICEPPGRDGEYATVCPVRIRSRMGSQVLLEFAPMDLSADGTRLSWQGIEPSAKGKPRPNPARRVVLDKEALLSWIELSPRLAMPAESDAPRVLKGHGLASATSPAFGEATSLVRAQQSLCGSTMAMDGSPVDY